MQHTDKNYENQINLINEKLVMMGSILEQQFSDALKVVASRDQNLANKVVEKDDLINQLNHDISDLVFQIIAMRQPMADDLRFLFCSIKIFAISFESVETITREIKWFVIAVSMALTIKGTPLKL